MEEPKVSTKQLLLLIWGYMTRHKGTLVLIAFFLFLANAANLVHPYVYKLLVDKLVALDGLEITSEAFRELVLYIGMLLGANMLGWIGWRVTSLTNASYIPKVMVEIARDMTLALFRHSVRFYQDNFTGSLVKRIFRLADAFESMYEAILWQVFGLVVALIGSFVILFFRAPLIAWMLLIWAIMTIVIHFFYSRWKAKVDLEAAEADSKTAAQFSDMITNFENIKYFATFKHEKKNLKKVQGTWRKLYTKSWRLSEYADAVQGMFVIIIEALLFYAAVVYWQKGLITIGDFVLIQGYLMVIIMRVWNIGRIIRTFYKSIANGKESAAILMMQPEIQEEKGAVDLEVKKGRVVFQGVRFGYQNDQPVLKQYKMDFKPGKSYALVGPSGSGKSTVGKLVLRLFDLQRGKILVDDQDIKKVKLDSLRSQISVVPQDPVLFHRSLKENIRYGRLEATDEEVIEAAKKARCHDFIENLEEGYDTLVGERGIKLSGGERQRVAIARAILKNAPILILDEATSSLDSESEQLIQEALDELMKDKTTIVIAHRLSTIMKMDQIVVMNQGQVDAVGTHKQLLRKKNGLYRKLWEIQAGGFIGE